MCVGCKKAEGPINLCFITVYSAEQPCADNGGCSHSCALLDGVEQCFCPTGFVLHRFIGTICIGKFTYLTTTFLDSHNPSISFIARYCSLSVLLVISIKLRAFYIILLVSLPSQSQ